jgi:hypothetical protein
MKQIHKEYGRPFLLEPTKLIRLMGKIHERLADHKTSVPHDSFEVFLSGERREEMTNLDDVLSLDNSPKRKIRRLLIVSTASTAGVARPDHEISVDFGRHKSDATGTKTVVAISVHSDNTGWADRTISELEEQVERTWLPYTSQGLTLLVIVGMAFLVPAFALQRDARLNQQQVGATTMWLRSSDFDRVEKLVRDQRTLSDLELRELATTQLRNILEGERPPHPPTTMTLRQTLSIAIPLVTVLVCFFVLIATCYPRAVFLWGDEEKRWAATRWRRKFMWSVIIAIFTGLLATSLYEGVIGLVSSK